MPQPNESSVQFSLRELMDLEEDRLRQEEQQAEAQRLQGEQARAERARAEREAEEQRLRDEAEARRLEEQRKREEEARLEAIRHAELEKARAEQEHAQRMAELAAHREHERQLAAAKKDAAKKKLTFMVAGLAVVLVAGGALAVKAVMASSQEAKDNADRAAQALAAREKADAVAAAERRELEGKLSDLNQRLAQAKDDAERAAIQNEINKTSGTSSGPRGGTKTVVERTEPPKPGCADGDPLCE